MKQFLPSILTGVIGGFIAMFVFLFILNYLEVFNIKIASTNYELQNITRVDSINNMDHNPITLYSPTNADVTLTPQDYTDNIVSYYNSLISVLVAIIVIFSIVSYFQLKFISEDRVIEVVRNKIKDSKEFEEFIRNTLMGKADEHYANNDRFEDVMYNFNERIKLLESNQRTNNRLIVEE